MLTQRNIALRLLPVLVVVWATVAVLGGALYLANHAGPPDGETAAKAGLGLCAVSVAVIVGRAVRRVTIPPLVAGLLPAFGVRPPIVLARGALTGPPATGPPVFVLLQVIRK